MLGRHGTCCAFRSFRAPPLALLLALLLAPALVACGGTSGAQNGPDASPGGDASPGSDAVVVDDAPPGSDAAVNPGDPNKVTFVATRNGAQLAGVHTYFLNPDGSLFVTLDTDATGTAVAAVAAGGSVTAVDAFTTDTQDGIVQHNLVTFEGVKPGDVLTLPDGGPAPFSVTITAPLAGTAASYTAYTTCGQGALTVNAAQAVATGSVTLVGCGASTDVLVVATQNGTSQSLYHANVALHGGGTIQLTGDTYSNFSAATFSYSRLPAAATKVSVEDQLGSARGLLVFAQNGTANVQNGQASLALQVPTVAGAIGVVATDIQLGAHHQVADVGPIAPAYTLDATNVLLPDIAQPPIYDLASRRVTWVEAAPGATADLSFTEIRVVRQSTATTGIGWDWIVIAPYTPGEVQFPLLPTDVLSWAPVAGDTVQSGFIANEKTPGGYDTLRTAIFGGQINVANRIGRSLIVQFPGD